MGKMTPYICQFGANTDFLCIINIGTVCDPPTRKPSKINENRDQNIMMKLVTFHCSLSTLEVLMAASTHGAVGVVAIHIHDGADD
jgi:hypothetical protein